MAVGPTNRPHFDGPVDPEACREHLARLLGLVEDMERNKEEREALDPDVNHLPVKKVRSPLEIRLDEALQNLKLGKFSKASRVLSSIGLANLADPAVLKALRDKYPDTPQEQLEEEEENYPSVEAWMAAQVEGVEVTDVQKYLSSRKRGTAGGPDGWTYDHLKQLIRGVEGSITVLTAFINIIIKGFLFWEKGELVDQRGVALRKDLSDGTKVRPIAIGCAFYMLACGVVQRVHKAGLRALASPWQKAIGTPDGVGGAALGLKLALELNPHWVGVVTDVTNAFGNGSRPAYFNGLRPLAGVLPVFAPQVGLFREEGIDWNAPNTVKYKNGNGDVSIEQKRGISQGGALSSPAYSIAQASIMLPILGAPLQEGRIALAKFVDDSGLAGDPDLALELTVKVREAMKTRLGVDWGTREVVDLNKVLTEDQTKAYEEAGFKVCTDGVMFVGVPIGTDDYIKSRVKDAGEAVKRLIRLCVDMVARGGDSDLQRVFRYLRMSVVPSFNHVLRNVDPAFTRPVAKDIDGAVVQALRSMMPELDQALSAANPDHREWALALLRLPIRLGGLGLISQAAVVDTAYVGAMAQSLSSVVGPRERGGLGLPEIPEELPPCLKSYKEALGRIREKVPGDTAHLDGLDLEDVWTAVNGIPNAQTLLSTAVNKIKKADLDAKIREEEENDPFGEIRRINFEAQQSKEGGAWLTAPPSLLGAQMSNPIFVSAVVRRLGLPNPNFVEGMECAKCGKDLDPYDNHALVCADLMGARKCGSKVHEDALKACIRESGNYLVPGQPAIATFYERKEGTGTTNHKADAGYIQAGQPASATVLVDCVMTNPRRSTRGSNSKYVPGEAARDAEADKLRHYQRYYEIPPHSAGTHIFGFGQETGGPLGPKAKELLVSLADSCAPHSYLSNLYRTTEDRYNRFLDRFSVVTQGLVSNYIRLYKYRCYPSRAAQPLRGDEPDSHSVRGSVSSDRSRPSSIGA